MTPAQATSVSPRLGVFLIFALLLAAFDLIYRPFLPLPPGYVGHDYALGLNAWLDGYFWFRNNGIAPPWFTPSFCAGQPFFADPQSSFYSLPQFLTFAVSPVTAAHLTLVISASLMFWGSYFLMRRVFATGITAALLVGGLMMFNGFLPHRLIIGHLGFQGFSLLPWLAVLLLMPVKNSANGLGAVLGAAAVLAYWVQSGFGTLMLAGGLSVLLLALAYGLYGGSVVRFVARGSLATAIALALSASKLAASFAFLANFPRTSYSLPGASSIPDALLIVAGALFLPSQWAHTLGTPHLANVQWSLGPHEWAFNFGFGAALLGLTLIVARWRQCRLGVRPAARHPLLWTILVLGMLWPLLFNLWHPTWHAFLKTVPILNSASSPLRWLIVYIPLIAVGIGFLLERVEWGRKGHVAVAACLIACILQAAFEPREFYLNQSYDARPVEIADSVARTSQWQPEIRVLGDSAYFEAGKYSTQLTSNETFVVGVSKLHCYNPVFGYRLEKFSAANLRPGPVLEAHDGFLNLKNPACYVFPDENGCKPGDRFRADQMANARAFVEYRPYAFAVSTRQMAANLVTQATLALVALGALAWAIAEWRRRRAA